MVVQCEGGSQWAGVSEEVRQVSPGPVSLDIFGLQAAITVLPTPGPGMHLTSFMPCIILELCKQAVLWGPVLTE